MAAAPAADDVGFQRFDLALNEVRVALGLAALGLWCSGRRARRESRPWRHARGRRVGLGLVAALAFASNYNFFLYTGLARHEFYHYYLGSKYFPELGYFRLYECSVEALRAQGIGLPPDVREITDLASKRRRPLAEVMAAAQPCVPDFGPARWEQFRSDVGFFHRLMGESGFVVALRDHGYNPSPVWTLMGRPLSTLLPANAAGLWTIARLDLWLLLSMLGAIGWAFGFEALCLAAIAWGTCGHTRYQWTGDAFLRQPWLVFAVGALCLVKKGRPAWGGALMALSSLERIFPAVFAAGWGLRAVRRAAGERVIEPAFLRFACGALAAALVLIPAGVAMSGRGPRVYLEFAENLKAMTEFTPLNGLGLRYLLQYGEEIPPPEVLARASSQEEAVQLNKLRLLESRRWLYWGALGAFAWLFWRATRPDPPAASAATVARLEDWEAMAMGSTLIPILTMPGSYYVGFVIAGALLATRRPRIGVALLALTTAFAASLVAAPQSPRPFAWSSAALLVYGAWVLVELQLPVAAQPQAAAPPVADAGSAPRPGAG
jgi:hypothetical protein